jgi:hypothetical protein
MKPKIIFLDIDGPIIPETCYLKYPFASYDRNFSEDCILHLLQICKETDAKIVTNSTHNFYYRENNTISLRDDLIRVIPKKYIHEDWRTNFGPTRETVSFTNVPYFYPSEVSKDRLKAITEWLNKHNYFYGDNDFICFDDEEFVSVTKCKWLFPIDYKEGIRYSDYELGCIYLGKVPLSTKKTNCGANYE